MGFDRLDITPHVLWMQVYADEQPETVSRRLVAASCVENNLPWHASNDGKSPLYLLNDNAVGRIMT